METFLQAALLKVTISQDQSKVATLGPYTLCLRSLLYGASEEKFETPFTVYRSFLTTESHVADLRALATAKGTLSLLGFTSASLAEAHALS